MSLESADQFQKEPKDPPISDLAAPPSTKEKNLGLQVTFQLPESTQQHLSQGAEAAIHSSIQEHVRGLMVEALKIAVNQSNTPVINIEATHIQKAEVLFQRRRTVPQTIWSYISKLSLVAAGTTPGFVKTSPMIALAVLGLSLLACYIAEQHS